jgi:hypothetical protein
MHETLRRQESHSLGGFFNIPFQLDFEIFKHLFGFDEGEINTNIMMRQQMTERCQRLHKRQEIMI